MLHGHFFWFDPYIKDRLSYYLLRIYTKEEIGREEVLDKCYWPALSNEIFFLSTDFFINK